MNEFTGRKKLIEDCGIQFFIPPEYQGQIVEVSFACNKRGIYRHTFDRSTGSEKLELAPWRLKEDMFEPWNFAPDEKRRWRRVCFVS